MSVHRITDGVLLTGGALDAARYCVEVAQRARARNGLPPSVTIARLAAALAPTGQGDAPDDVGEQSGSGPVSALQEVVGTREAAGLLGCSPRQARRLAPLLGGRLIGGRLALDRQSILDHLEGKTA